MRTRAHALQQFITFHLHNLHRTPCRTLNIRHIQVYQEHRLVINLHQDAKSVMSTLEQ